MGIGFGYLRLITGSVWMSTGFHAAFQTGAQLVLAHDVVDFAGDAAVVLSSTRVPRWVPAVAR